MNLKPASAQAPVAAPKTNSAPRDVGAGTQQTNATRGLETPADKAAAPAVDITHKPEGVKDPKDPLVTNPELGKAGPLSITAGKQYGPAFRDAETATEYARMGVKQGWFQSAAVVKGENGYTVREAKLPPGFSTGDTVYEPPSDTGTSPSLADVAENLKAVQPGKDLATLVTHEGVVGDYRELQPKVEYAGLNGDPTAAQRALFGPGLEGVKDDNVRLQTFGQAVTNEAQAALDRAGNATQTMLGYTTESGFTEQGEKAVKTALNDTKEINETLKAKEDELKKVLTEYQGLLDKMPSGEYSHTNGVYDKAKHDAFNDKIKEVTLRRDALIDDIAALHDKRGEILKEDNAEFLQRLPADESLKYTDALNGKDAKAKSDVAASLRKQANEVTGSIKQSREDIANGKFNWKAYPQLIQLTAADLGYNAKQYQGLMKQVDAAHMSETRAELAKGGLALGLSILPGGGWARAARIAGQAIAGSQVLDGVDQYLRDRRLTNTGMDPAHNIFESQGAPGEAGLAMAALSYIPEAKALIGASMRGLKAGERVSDATLENWVKASPKASNESWYRSTLRDLQNTANYYRGGTPITKVNGAGLAERHERRRRAGRL